MNKYIHYLSIPLVLIYYWNYRETSNFIVTDPIRSLFYAIDASIAKSNQSINMLQIRVFNLPIYSREFSNSISVTPLELGFLQLHYDFRCLDLEWSRFYGAP